MCAISRNLVTQIEWRENCSILLNVVQRGWNVFIFEIYQVYLDLIFWQTCKIRFKTDYAIDKIMFILLEQFQPSMICI